jgi:hypothetical protein
MSLIVNPHHVAYALVQEVFIQRLKDSRGGAEEGDTDFDK